ncbi:hypothetical protein Tcan_08000 [Toxocara canis]|uniref:Uncharacterized protein n=1 Tax=Toxocara canis TaxID=6265 RepID=A0A0B2VDA2_TOXCA|nr:hypothetical protein Tcan_08000 [Toxocara canis]
MEIVPWPLRQRSNSNFHVQHYHTFFHKYCAQRSFGRGEAWSQGMHTIFPDEFGRHDFAHLLKPSYVKTSQDFIAGVKSKCRSCRLLERLCKIILKIYLKRFALFFLVFCCFFVF